MREILVSNQTARDLKELGFDEPCWFYDGVNNYFGEAFRSSQTNHTMTPTVYQAREWLIKEFKIFLEVTMSDWGLYMIQQVDYCHLNSVNQSYVSKEYSSPTEALQAELPVVLKKLLYEKMMKAEE